MRLLIIEDEDRLSGILKSRLGDVGFTVDVVGSAADANAALEIINYDAVVLDLGLPDHDGLTVLATARRIVVERHDGSLTLESQPGRTVFRVRLPFSQKA